MPEATWIQRFIAPLVSATGAERLRDDVALFDTDGPTIVTMDTIVEKVHFLSGDPLSTVGQKLVRVNVSDIFAKGAMPKEALLSIAWPHGRAEADFRDLIEGIARDLKAFGVSLIGGDFVGIDGPLTLTMSLTGQCLKDQPVRRSGGRPGQELFISGEIGWGGLGLKAASASQDNDVAARYRVPAIGSPEVAHTVADLASASMDVSDGLLIDVDRLATASGCGAKLQLDLVPLAAPTEIVHEIIAQCTSGDDYLVLMSADAGLSVPGFTKIGELTASPGLVLAYQASHVNTPSTLGFEH